MSLIDKEHKENILSPYKGRIPRLLLLLGSLIGLVFIIMGYFDRGPLLLENFNSYGKFFISCMTYILLVLVSIRANFKCQQITCPSIFSIILLLAYSSYPAFLMIWGFLLLCIALYIIIKTLYYYTKRNKAF